MTIVLSLIAVLCVLYYIVILLYSGVSTSFSFIWLFIAGFLTLLVLGREYYRKNPEKLPLWVPVSITTLCCVGLVVFGIIETLIFAGVASRDVPRLDYLIVLGARVKKEGISKSLQYRLDKAMEYVELNPDTVLILSGGQGKDEPMPEAKAMYDYLVFNGVRENQMLMELDSTSTVENLAYSRVLIEEEEAKKQETNPSTELWQLPEIGVVTSDFHVFRAEQLGAKWGMPKLHGIASPSDPILFVHFCVRECAAILKDKLMGNM